MAIFVTAALGASCAFMLYALYRFSRDAMKARPQKVLRFRAASASSRLEPLHFEAGLEVRVLNRHEMVVFPLTKKRDEQVVAPEARISSRGSL